MLGAKSWERCCSLRFIMFCRRSLVPGCKRCFSTFLVTVGWVHLRSLVVLALIWISSTMRSLARAPCGEVFLRVDY